MENKKFLNPQELFDEMSELRRKAKESIISIMKENNLTYVYTADELIDILRKDSHIWRACFF